ncbi:MAG: hypothetical protein CMG26_03855 [Candidatus Marinimicrobia bacterium]|nr:hypothetical protein [Candidatus Neomarinimicrobiota bacterium]
MNNIKSKISKWLWEKLLPESFDEESKKEIRATLDELDKAPKEELLKTQDKVKREFWDNHRHKIIISVIIFYLFFIPFYNKYGFDREGLFFILSSTVAILIWYFKGKSVEVSDDPL